MVFVTIVFAVILAAFVYALWHTVKEDPRTLELGTWTIFSVVMFIVVLTMILAQLGGPGLLGLAILVMGGLFIFLIASFVFDIAVVYFSWQIWRKEYHTLANLLLPIVFALFAVMNIIQGFYKTAPAWLQPMFTAANLLQLYFILVFINFLVGAIVYGFIMKRRDNDYYVVLGAGLINGHKVSRLLGNRIKAAVDAANKKATPTTIVFSGGKGGDEQLSEAEAMRDYAVTELGYPVELTLLEDQSRTTRENMRFSREVIDAHAGGENVPFTFFTSEYHVFRAALQARQFGVNTQGRGGHTPLYFRIPAFIREYIAVLNMRKRRHAAIVVLAIVLAIIIGAGSLF